METTHPIPSPRPGGSAVKIFGGLVLLAVLFLVGFLPKLHNDAKLTARAKESSTELPEVELASPRMAAADPILLPGSIEALTAATVQARTSGYVSKIYADIGAHVKAGQVLADIQSPDVDQQAAQANADTAKSRATVGQSQADVARSRAGVAQTESDLIRQEATIKQAQAGVAGAQARLAEAKASQAQADAKLATARQAVDVQKANLAQAQAQYDLAEATEKRYAGLLKEGFVAQQDYDQAAAAKKTSAANVQAVKANLQASNSDVQAAQQAVAASAAATRSSQSDIDAAQSNVRAAKATYESMKSTVDAAKAGVDASRANVTANQAAVTSSEANARRYAVLSAFQHVIAPFDGVITARNVDIGSLVSPGQTSTATSGGTTPTAGLFGIAREDTLRIFVNVPQSDFQSVRPGTTAKVYVRELPKQKFDGQVFQLAGALDSGTRTLRTEVRLANPKNILLPGMYAQVEISPAEKRSSLRVPANTLMIDAKGNRIAIVDADDRVHFRTVEFGKDYGSEIEVLNGIGPDDRLIANPSDELAEGGKVRIAPKKAGPDNGSGAAK